MFAIDDVGHRALGMDPAANRVGFHADADEVIGLNISRACCLVRDILFTPRSSPF